MSTEKVTPETFTALAIETIEAVKNKKINTDQANAIANLITTSTRMVELSMDK